MVIKYICKNIYYLIVCKKKESEVWLYKAYDKAAIQSVIDEYRLSDIQSESEVRSKFIVRLSEVLGYSSQFRGEEFPVYGLWWKRTA